MAFDPTHPSLHRFAGANLRPPYPSNPPSSQYESFYPRNFPYDPDARFRVNFYAQLTRPPRWPSNLPPTPPISPYYLSQIRLSRAPHRPPIQELWDNIGHPSHIHYRLRRICEYLDEFFDGLPYFVAGGILYPLYWILSLLVGFAVYPLYWFLAYIANETTQPFHNFTHNIVEQRTSSPIYFAFRIPLAALLFGWDIHPSYWYFRIPLALLLFPWEGLKHIDWDKLGWFLENLGWVVGASVTLFLDTVVLGSLLFCVLRPLSHVGPFVRDRWRMNKFWCFLVATVIVTVFVHRPLLVEKVHDMGPLWFTLEHEPKRWAAYTTEARSQARREENGSSVLLEEKTIMMYSRDTELYEEVWEDI